MSEHKAAELSWYAAVRAMRCGGSADLFGGITLARLLDAANKAGYGPEDVEVSGNGKNYGLELFVVGHPANAEFDEGDDD